MSHPLGLVTTRIEPTAARVTHCVLDEQSAEAVA